VASRQVKLKKFGSDHHHEERKHYHSSSSSSPPFNLNPFPSPSKDLVLGRFEWHLTKYG
jgi:hypothetical protein